MDNLRHLSYLATAAEHKSITHAAAALEVSQPAVSAAIKRIETEYGYTIFIRHSAQGLTLTTAGKRFVQQAQRLLEGVREFDRQARGIAEEITGEIRLGCYFITAPFLLPQFLSRFSTEFPLTRVHLHESDLRQVILDLKGAVTDVAITYDMYVDDAVTLERLYEVEPHVLLAANHPLANGKDVSLQQLVEEPLLLLDLTITQDYFVNFFRSYGLNPNIRYRLRSFEMVRSLVGAEQGFSFGFLPLASNKTYQGANVVRLPIREKLPRPWVCMAFPRQLSPTRTLRTFMEQVRREFGTQNPT